MTIPAQPTHPAATQRTPQQIFELTKKLLAMGDFHDAAQHAALLRSHFPNQTPIIGLHGIAMAAVGAARVALPDLIRASDETQTALRDAPEDDPNRPRIVDQLLRLLTDLARVHESLGHEPDADEALARALDLDPETPETVRARIEILAGRGALDAARSALDDATENGLDELAGALSAAAITLSKPDASHEETHVLARRLLALTDRVGLDAATQSVALRRAGALFDRAGEYDEAYRAFTRASNFTRGAYDAATHARATNAVIQGWTSASMGKLVRPERDDTGRVFVVGAAHAGGEVLARALSRHPEAGTIGQTDLFTALAARFAGARPTPHRPIVPACAGLRRDQLAGVAEGYTRHVDASFGADRRRVTIDPGTLHTHLIGLVWAAMPGSRFVFVRREPRAHLLSCYFNGVAGNHPYTKELPTTAAYLRDIDRMMDHWAGTLRDLGAEVIDTSHEALAGDPIGEPARIAGVLGLGASDRVRARVHAEPADHPERYAKRIDPVAQLLRKQRS